MSVSIVVLHIFYEGVKTPFKVVDVCKVTFSRSRLHVLKLSQER